MNISKILKFATVSCVFLLACKESNTPTPEDEKQDFIIVGMVPDSTRFVVASTSFPINRNQKDTFQINLELENENYNLNILTVSDSLDRLTIAIANNGRIEFLRPFEFLHPGYGNHNRHFLQTMWKSDSIFSNLEFWQVQRHFIFDGNDRSAFVVPNSDTGFFVPFRLILHSDKTLIGWIKMRLERKNNPVEGLLLESYAWINLDN